MATERLPVFINGQDAGVLMNREELEDFVDSSHIAANDEQVAIKRQDGRWIVSLLKRE